jgi:hypothetical protein
MSDSWYSDMVAALQPLGCKVAVDTSDAPLAALAADLERAAPDLIKPNSEELAGLAGVSAESLENAVARGDAEPVVTAPLGAIFRLTARGAKAGAGKTLLPARSVTFGPRSVIARNSQGRPQAAAMAEPRPVLLTAGLAPAAATSGAPAPTRCTAWSI